MKFTYALFFTLLFALFLTQGNSFNAFAHGEDKLGPNKGYVRMPGAFHTELVSETDGNFLVYLLDVNNQNPTVKNSSVEMKVKDSKGSLTLKCLTMEDHFHCVNDKKISDAKDVKIIIKARRLGVQGDEAVYDLPLKLSKPVMDHSKMKH